MNRFVALLVIAGVQAFLPQVANAKEPTQKGEAAKREALWEAFEKVKPKEIERINTYCENPSLTDICFWANENLYFLRWRTVKSRSLRL